MTGAQNGKKKHSFLGVITECSAPFFHEETGLGLFFSPV
jgi:hypothetical protein